MWLPASRRILWNLRGGIQEEEGMKIGGGWFTAVVLALTPVLPGTAAPHDDHAPPGPQPGMEGIPHDPKSGGHEMPGMEKK